MANPIKSLISQTAIYGVSSIVGRFLNYLLVPIHTDIFVPREYGVVSEMYAYVSILLILLTYGMETGYFRFCQKSEFKRSTVYSTSFTSLLVTSTLFGLFFYFNIDSFSSWLGYSDNSTYVILLGLTVALDAIGAIPFAKLRIENRAKHFAIIKFINIGVNIGLNLFFLLFVPKFLPKDNFFYTYFFDGLDVGYIFLANFLASLVTLVLLLPQMFAAFRPYLFDFTVLKNLFLYSYPLLFAGIAGMMSENLDRILLKHLLVVPDGAQPTYVMSQIGIYGANVKIAVLMTLFIQAFRYAAEPFFFNYSKNDDSKEMYARVMKYFVVFGLFIFLGVTLLLDYVKYIINSDYHEGLSIVPILLISKLFFGMVFNLSIWYKLTNKTHYGAILAFLGALVSVGLNFILIPRFGYMGAAWASICAYFSMMLLSFLLMQKYYAIKYQIGRIFLYFAVALSLFALNIYFRQLTEYYVFINVLFIALFGLLFIKLENVKLRIVLNQFKRKK